mgnify:CR=1 FL=1
MREVVRRQREVSRIPTPEEQMAGFRGWNERGYLPHRDEPGLTQFVTFRLADSFPAELRDEWEKLLRIEDERERRTQVEAWLDLGHGLCHLKDKGIAGLVSETMQKFDGTRYHMIAFTIMPNHVHTLFQPMGGWSVSTIVASWKKYTAKGICGYLRKVHGIPGNANLRIGSGIANLPIGSSFSVPHTANQEIGVPR